MKVKVAQLPVNSADYIDNLVRILNKAGLQVVKGSSADKLGAQFRSSKAEGISFVVFGDMSDETNGEVRIYDVKNTQESLFDFVGFEEWMNRLKEA